MGGLQNIFLGPAAINRVEGNIETFSTRVRSREKEYESEITVVVDEQIPSDDLFWYFIFGVFQTILSLLVVPAYPGRKRTRLGNPVCDLLGVNFGPGIFLSFVGSPRDFLRF